MSSILRIENELLANAYPGRGIVLGRSLDNKYAVSAYFIMGRSENSRNRVFTETPDGIRTEAVRPEEMEDPSLVIYHPVRVVGNKTVVTNGDQTDTVRDALLEGKSYIDALRTRTFEPDAPNYTPRISGIINEDGSYALSILKAFSEDPTLPKRFFYEYAEPLAGYGHFIHTYMNDGNPLPSFRGEPKTIRIEQDIEAFANLIWNTLNESNKISLFVRYINVETGEAKTIIHNKYSK